MTGARPPALSIGSVGDHGFRRKALDEAIMEIMRQVEDLSRDVTSPMELNVVYFLDGKYVPLDFEGVRVARFSKGNGLLVQAAVPPDVTEGDRGLLLALLEGGIDLAEEYARRRNISDDLNSIRGIYERLALRGSAG